MQLVNIVKQSEPEQKISIEIGTDGKLEFSASKTIDDDGSFILSVTSSEQSVPSLSDTFKLLNVDVPFDINWFHHPAEITIDHFSLMISEKTVSDISISIGTVHPWNLVENFLVFENITLHGQILSPLDSESALLELQLQGVIHVGAATLNVSVEFPDLLTLARQKEWEAGYELNIREAIGPGDETSPEQVVEINAFIEQFSPIVKKVNEEPLSFIFLGELDKPLNLVIFLKSIGLPVADLHSELAINELKFRYDTGSGSFQFFIDVSDVWKIDLGGNDLALSDLFFYLSHSGESDSTMSCELGAMFSFCQMELILKAQHSGADGGWQFEGVLESLHENDEGKAIAENIETSKFNTEISTLFGIKLPDAILNDLTLRRIDISFNTASKAFTFNCDAILKVGDKEVEALVTIDIAPDGKGFRERFGGHIIVMPLVDTNQNSDKEAIFFDLILEHEAKKATLMASYRAPGEDSPSLSLRALVEELSGIKDFPPLNIKLRDAYFLHRSDGQKSLDLLGLDIDGGLDLAQIKLPDLPLLSSEELFGADESLRLSFQAMVLSRAVESDEQAELSALLGAHELTFPADLKLKPPIDLNVNLQIGSKVQQISAPVSISNEEDAKGNGLQVTQAAENKADNDSVVKVVDGTQWLKIQKSFGPVHMERVGIGFGEDEEKNLVSAILDGGISVAGLSVSLDGLTVKAPLSDLTNFEFSLDGLGIDFRNGPLEIDGALIKKPDANGNTQFAGTALLRMPELTLSALGVFANTNDHPSLFIYALLDKTIGGPAFFFVTGLAAGFGYNRSLILPSIDKVVEFPLVSQVQGGDNPKLGEKKREIPDSNPITQLEALEGLIPPSVGESFLAIGVRFNSFKTINSFALLIFQFKQRFEIDLLGLSTLSSPPAVKESKKPVTPIAYAQLAIKATFVPEEGTLRVRGQLTRDSYVFSRENHLSGGFALYTWFSDTEKVKAGDFVATIGGYHPAYQVPAHYPTVPRLSLQWQVNDELHIKGNAYFALTAQAVMAGGRFEATWHSGDFKAWFSASADFLIAWQPYFYDASVYVEMGAEATIHVFGTHHLSFNGGASVHLWGPEFTGHANVHFKVLAFSVAFDVDFGAGASAPEAIDWGSFKQAFLSDELCAISIQSGLLSTSPQGDLDHWIVDSHDVMFKISSLVPITSALSREGSQRVGINPMGLVIEGDVDGFLSNIDVLIKDSAGNKVSTCFQFTPIKQRVPSALWGTAKIKGAHGKRFVDPPDLNGESLIKDIVMGITVKTDAPIKPNSTGDMSTDKLLKAQRHEDDVSWKRSMKTTSEWGVPKSVATQPNKEKRANLLKALNIPLGNVTAPGYKPTNFYGIIR